MSRFRTAPEPTDAEKAYLDDLPRPHRLLAVGGPAKYWHLSKERVESAASRLAERGGTAILVTSPRTPPEIATALDGLDLPNLRLVAGPEPRFPVLLDDADEIYVTGDSTAMMSEAVLSGKPVGIVPLELSAEGQRILGQEPKDKRDLRKFWSSLRDRGLAGTIDKPVAGQLADPGVIAADAVKALLGDRVE